MQTFLPQGLHQYFILSNMSHDATSYFKVDFKILYLVLGGCRVCMVVGFTTTCATGAYHH
jgi:hypothetical protein